MAYGRRSLSPHHTKLEMELLLCLLLSVLAASLFYYNMNTNRRRSGTGRRLPPGPRQLPVVGNFLDLRHGNLHHTLAHLARVHGPVLRLRLGLATAVVISSRDAAREAFTRHDRRLAAHAVPDTTRALGFSDRSMIWLPSGDPRWRTLRGVVATHVFSPRSLAAARGVRERKVRDMVEHIRGRAGREVDVGQLVYSGVLNLVSSVLLSVDLVDMGTESAQGFRELVEGLIQLVGKPNISDNFPFLRPLDLQGWRRCMAKQFEKLFRVFDDIIDHRLAEASSGDKHGDFLDALLELMSTGKMARDNVKTILVDVFAAGSDTISVTVEWAMAELLRNPGIMAKVRVEIEGTLGSKETVEEPDVAGMPYVQAVIKEAMRLHPVAPLMLPHLAMDDGIEIGGYAVPKGSSVIFNTWAIMRDPAAWERPDEFVPERFLDTAAEVDFWGKHFEFIPFGAGRRVCPGIPMAERVVPLILASLLHAFEWRLPNGVAAEELDVSEKFAAANVLAFPLRAVPVIA